MRLGNLRNTDTQEPRFSRSLVWPALSHQKVKGWKRSPGSTFSAILFCVCFVWFVRV